MATGWVWLITFDQGVQHANVTYVQSLSAVLGQKSLHVPQWSILRQPREPFSAIASSHRRIEWPNPSFFPKAFNISNDFSFHSLFPNAPLSPLRTFIYKSECSTSKNMEHSPANYTAFHLFNSVYGLTPFTKQPCFSSFTPWQQVAICLIFVV